VNAPEPFPFPVPPELRLPAEYADLHRSAPLKQVTLASGGTACLASGYRDVRRVLTDARFSRSAYQGGTMFARKPASLALVLSDAPEHTRRRRAIASAFDAHQAEKARAHMEAMVTGLIADMVAAGPVADLVDAISVPFPLTVICDLLGVPAADKSRLRPWVNAMMSTSDYPADVVAAAHREMNDYFSGLVDAVWGDRAAGDPAEGRAAGGGSPEGLLAKLGRREPGERGLSREEAATMASGLLMAGYETTSNQLTICVYVLQRDRHLWEHLVANPAALPSAIEEILRWTPFNNTGGIPHVALADVEMPSGEVIPAGHGVIPLTSTANRDPEVFRNPDELELTRTPNSHLAFGYGPHYCLGAHLARVELQAAIGCLLRELPGLRLAAPPSALRWRQGMFINGLWELPVRWAGAPAQDTRKF
jgi:cytochrome P450